MRVYGQTVILISGKSGTETVLTAFLQPVLKERETAPAVATPLGAVSRRRWRYVGPAGQNIQPGDRICFNSLRLVVQESEAVYFHSEVLYHRAVLQPEKEAAG